MSDYVKTAVQTALSIDEDDAPGDILIFFTGQEECEHAAKMINEAVRTRKNKNRAYELMAMPLYAGHSYSVRTQAISGIRLAVS